MLRAHPTAQVQHAPLMNPYHRGRVCLTPQPFGEPRLKWCQRTKYLQPRTRPRHDHLLS